MKLCISLCARQNDVNAHVIPGAHRSARHMRRTFDTCFTLSLIYHLYVLFVWISYQARFGLKISYPAIVFTMVIGLLNCGSFIVHILLLGTSKVFTLSVFLPCAWVHILLPGTRRYHHSYIFQHSSAVKYRGTIQKNIIQISTGTDEISRVGGAKIVIFSPRDYKRAALRENIVMRENITILAPSTCDIWNGFLFYLATKKASCL